MDEARLAEIQADLDNLSSDQRDHTDLAYELITEVRRLRALLKVAGGCPPPGDTSWTDRDVREFLEDLHASVHG